MATTAVARVWAVEYETEVKPLLRERCYACHGALKQEGGLRLDTVTGILAGGESGPVAVAGDGEGSLLVRRVATSDVSDRMPPEHEGEAFKASEVGVLRAWIGAGAAGPADEEP
ncbi:MAG: c-type cytochrome domain-containing protein, partial [Verrucomicrobiales bacterium]